MTLAEAKTPFERRKVLLFCVCYRYSKEMMEDFMADPLLNKVF